MKESRKDVETSPPQSPTEQLLSRDLAAWLLAKEAIAKAAGRG